MYVHIKNYDFDITIESIKKETTVKTKIIELLTIFSEEIERSKAFHETNKNQFKNKIWKIEELVKTNESKSHEETKSKIDYIISNYDDFMTNLKESQNIQISMFDFDFNYFYKFVIGKNENKPYVNLVSEEDDYPYSEIIQWIE